MSAPIPSTPFQATLLPPSFRGVPFIVEENEDEFGQRGQLHEYPERDIPWAEPLGRRARKWQFRAYVLGDDCAAQAAVLRAAVEQKGPGLLVHPDIGMVMAQPDPTRPSRGRATLTEGRKITFELAFVEAGQVNYPTGSADTQAGSITAANGLDTAAAQDLQSATGNVTISDLNITPVQTASDNLSGSLSGLSAPVLFGQPLVGTL
jgi:prophage DNA circulation protein